ncbi:hypothetical protein TELCIR_18055 [Teladorsagia circumcincta]|uniref:Uncharacterized protein n=1 Tax=Teladorsagia circumcincta TaxID=45464 RepID=A0A2G9TR84_TELCI|nr:hypothetical protein TELCIR_18055 [Teladorsagia circumcincta]
MGLELDHEIQTREKLVLAVQRFKDATGVSGDYEPGDSPDQEYRGVYKNDVGPKYSRFPDDAGGVQSYENGFYQAQ